ncbi:MAG: hypothetical protein JSV88_12415 [Candidatus Aminicenantes bacterium]|nr:MAG: hypothetical protein JSV88_12415 [Candidatus Aminicenantes bacterium]
MMNRDTLKQALVVSLFWGALWGIVEATVGYLVHLVIFIPGIAGFIMFPIGFYFMTRAYKDTGKPGVLFSTAAVAASIKLVDLLLPNLSPIHTINPAIAILMESAAVILVFKLLDMKPVQFRFKEALIASTGWRLGFLFYSSILFFTAISQEFIRMGLGHILRFLLLESLLNALIIIAYLKAEKVFKGEKTWSFRVRPAAAAAALAAALLVKLALAAI